MLQTQRPEFQTEQVERRSVERVDVELGNR